jgi:hypothetical protein
MMAQAARDPLFWACFTVAGQDSIHALGNPNAMDLCERCHFPQGWLAGRSDPPNASRMTKGDFDGVHCDFCHRQFDPFFETTASGAREGSDWPGYWDETNASRTPSAPAAQATLDEDRKLAQAIKLFSGGNFYAANVPFSANYKESGSGQYFVSPDGSKRASFADAEARHKMYYSRYHKSKYFCATCHDVSNPALANLGANATQPLPSEMDSAFSYFHVERTFSEFMLSAYGQQEGAAGIGPFAPGVFTTSQENNYITMCQDCHMRDGVGAGADKNGVPVRPDGSVEHPKSGQPIHDFTGGNMWVPWVLASAVSGSPNYDATNASLLGQGPAVLTLDLRQGLGLDPIALLDGVERSRQQLSMAATIQNVSYDSSSGQLSFRVQNQTGHKLISGFPEGRRMYVNIRAYGNDGSLIHEVNPYDTTAGTLKGLGYSYLGGTLPAPATLKSAEVYRDDLVYEMKPSSTLTEEAATFHFVLADGRYKDNRIPPQGFRINEAAARLSQPVWEGVNREDYFSAAEYAGGYRDVSLNIATGASFVEVNLYYQTTSREYIEFLRDEIRGTGNLTLESSAYIIQTDPFFSRLKAWGDTIWQLWTHNMSIPGAAPVLMTQGSAGTPAGPPPPPGSTPPPPGDQPTCNVPGAPTGLSATGGNRSVRLSWSAVSPSPTGGYNVYYDQSGKQQLVASVSSGTTSYNDNKLNQKTQYCYVVTAWNDCNGNGSFDAGVDQESSPSTVVCASTR